MNIEFAEIKREINVTLSVRLDDECGNGTVDRVLKIQKVIADELSNDFALADVTKISDASAFENWSQQQSGQCMFVCPEPTIHFSILNVIQKNINSVPFETARETLEEQEWFPVFRTTICKALFELPRQEFEIRGIYNTEDGCSSVSLMTYPTRIEKSALLDWVRRLNRAISELYGAKNVPECFRVKESKRCKRYWHDEERYFATNILRFLSLTGNSPKQSARLSSIVTEQDVCLNRTSIRFEARPIVVISNAYLTNLHPPIDCQSI